MAGNKHEKSFPSDEYAPAPAPEFFDLINKSLEAIPSSIRIHMLDTGHVWTTLDALNAAESKGLVTKEFD